LKHTTAHELLYNEYKNPLKSEMVRTLVQLFWYSYRFRISETLYVHRKLVVEEPLYPGWNPGTLCYLITYLEYPIEEATEENIRGEKFLLSLLRPLPQKY